MGIPQTGTAWKTKSGERFQNNRSIFTILDVPHISRSWINDVKTGEALSANAPKVWVDWVTGGVYEPLEAERVSRVRPRTISCPKGERQMAIIGLSSSSSSRTPRGNMHSNDVQASLLK